MSTNYYWLARAVATGELMKKDTPDSHIGKRASVGGGSMGFTWAADSGYVTKLCQANPNTPIIVSEYGEEYTGDDFLNLIEKYVPIYTMAGQTFC